MRMLFSLLGVMSMLLCYGTATAQSKRAAEVVRPGGDGVATYVLPRANTDYERREVMIAMRDGVKLFTVIVVPKGVRNAPIVLTRTPYNAAARAARSDSDNLVVAGQYADQEFAKAGYIRVFQDIRGKYGSEGDYVVARPLRGALNSSGIDHATDAYDTIAWLVDKANLPESNGRVGMIGSSYEGLTGAMALRDPHPALKVVAAESPLVDGWIGDDWFHNGAFRNSMLDYIAEQTGGKGSIGRPPHNGYDDYSNFLSAGSTGDWASSVGMDQLPFWRRLVDNPAYTAMWRGQALDKLLAANPSNIPTIWEQGLWDQEDIYGAVHSWEALKAAGNVGNNFLVVGPWYHSQVNGLGRKTGPLEWNGDTVLAYWRRMVLPLFNQYLKDGPPADLPSATIYNTGEDRWDSFTDWPQACETGCRAPLTPIYLDAESRLSFKPVAAGADRYVSDPAKPVPYLPRPIDMDGSKEAWRTWLLSDQRHVDGRTDVLIYSTDVLTRPVSVSGAPIADLFARTTGSDGDFVVKIIDVFPSEDVVNPAMGGYELAISMDIFRGRYRDSLSDPAAIPAGKVQRYKFRLPVVNHVFQPGHRIMIQIQSTLFPIYDRNPQTFVPNIFLAKKSDYRAATISIQRGGTQPSRVWLPVVSGIER